MVTNVQFKDDARVEVAERITAEEFFRIAPEDRKAELIDGIMEIPMPPLTIHQRLQNFLLTLLRLFVEEHQLGEVFGSRTAVELAGDQAPEPDILFVANARSHIVQEKGVVGAPDLIIEILSAGTARNDRGPKFRAYERAGVRELWLIDPYGLAGTDFYRLEEGTFCPVHPNAKNVIESSVLEGFWLDVSWLWPGEDGFIPVRKALGQILDE